jgi:hypothetical protein
VLRDAAIVFYRYVVLSGFAFSDGKAIGMVIGVIIGRWYDTRPSSSNDMWHLVVLCYYSAWSCWKNSEWYCVPPSHLYVYECLPYSVPGDR